MSKKFLDSTGVSDLVNSIATNVANKYATKAIVTQSANGLMSAADKAKLDGIATGANKTVVDSALSSTSTNPVQNKVINSALAGKAASSHTHSDYALKSKYGDTTIDVGRKAGTDVGARSTAEGYGNTANGNYSHAEGEFTTASGGYSHAEGFYSIASGTMAHAEGNRTTASGSNSHAEGYNTTASGAYSHSGGAYTKALHDNEVAYGIYNLSNNDTLFSIGDGSADDARHNAFEITIAGGKLHNKDIATADGFIKVNSYAGYDCNTLYDAGLYLCGGSSTNTPNDLKYGSLFVMPYRKPYGNSGPDYCAQIFIPNGDASDTSMWYRTSLQNTYQSWKKILSSENGVLSGTLVAQSNTNYTTPQVRNVTMSDSAPSGGSNGQIHYQYS